MAARGLGQLLFEITICLGLAVTLCGCTHFDQALPGPADVPNESAKVAMPVYRVEPPDVLLLNAITLLPKPNHPIKPLDVVRIQFPYKELPPADMKVLEADKLIIDNFFPVDLNGTITLAPPLNLIVNIYNMTQAQAEEEIARQLKAVAKVKPEYVDKGGVKVRLVQASGLQVVQGNHLIRPDGTITLGIYGSIYVAGLTVEEVKDKVEKHLSQFLQDPLISVEVVGYNSKVYYVIYDGGGAGEAVARLPFTGNETVLDAVGQVNGLPAVASKSLIWISRPSHDGTEGKILPVDWTAITQHGIAKLNYQVLPGDRLYVRADPLVTLYTNIDRFISPIDRVMGGILLGTSTYRSLKFVNSSNINGTGF